MSFLQPWMFPRSLMHLQLRTTPFILFQKQVHIFCDFDFFWSVHRSHSHFEEGSGLLDKYSFDRFVSLCCSGGIRPSLSSLPTHFLENLSYLTTSGVLFMQRAWSHSESLTKATGITDWGESFIEAIGEDNPKLIFSRFLFHFPLPVQWFLQAVNRGFVEHLLPLRCFSLPGADTLHCSSQSSIVITFKEFCV